MKIIQSTINEDAEKFFEILLGSWEWYNYSTSCYIRVFEYEDNETLSLDNLNNIFSKEIHYKKIKGDLKEVNNEQFESILKGCLGHPLSLNKAEVTKMTVFSEIRLNAFKQLIDVFFPTSKKIIYEHIPEPHSFFDYGIIWNFCFILLENGKGIVISAGASD